MTCDEIRELLELYSIGVLEREEHAGISAHLEGGCEVCSRNLRNAIGFNTAILAAAPEADAPLHLRNRVAAMVRLTKAPSKSWAWMGVAGALAAGLAWTMFDSRGKSSQLAEVRSQRDQIDREVARLNTAFAFLRAPETRPAGAKPDAAAPRGTYFISPRGVLLIASNLRPLAAGQTYEMWVIPKGQAPRPAGLFRPDNAGGAVHFIEEPVDVQSAAALAISVEPESGSTAPTTTPLLVTPMAGV